MGASTPIIRDADEGEKLWFSGGGVHTWKVRADEVNGSFFVFEDELVRGKATPYHSHPQDELVYVIEGELVYFGEGLERRVCRGAVIATPRGTPHAFIVVSETARLLFVQSPGEGESFYRRASEPAVVEDGAVVEGPVDFGRIRAAAIETGATSILGPPPRLTTP